MSNRIAVLTSMVAAMLATSAGAENPDATPSCQDTPLIGYGLAVGLRGTGDSLAKAPLTAARLEVMLARDGGKQFEAKRFDGTVASVIVTTKLRVCTMNGVQTVDQAGPLDLTVSAMGDARSLEHGALLTARLIAENGQTYALGEGAIESCPGQSIADWRRVPTAACVLAGGIVRR